MPGRYKQLAAVLARNPEAMRRLRARELRKTWLMVGWLGTALAFCGFAAGLARIQASGWLVVALFLAAFWCMARARRIEDELWGPD